MYESLYFSEKEVVALTNLSRKELLYLKNKAVVSPVINRPIRYTYNQLILLRIIKLLKQYLSSQFIGEIVEDNLVFDCDLKQVSLMVVTGSILLLDDSKEVRQLFDELLLPLNAEIFEDTVRKDSKINSILPNSILISAKKVLIVPVYRVRKNLREKAKELDIYNYQKRESFGLTNLMPKNIA